MKYAIMVKDEFSKKYLYYAGYTKLFATIFSINSDLSINDYDTAKAVCDGLKEHFPSMKFKIKEIFEKVA